MKFSKLSILSEVALRLTRTAHDEKKKKLQRIRSIEFVRQEGENERAGRR